MSNESNPYNDHLIREDAFIIPRRGFVKVKHLVLIYPIPHEEIDEHQWNEKRHAS
jgi:hypothetical protein